MGLELEEHWYENSHTHEYKVGSKGRTGYEYVDTTYLLGFEMEEGMPC